MFEIVLVEPQIAVNTGSVIRLCANVGARLHLVEPLGFALDDASLRRGGLDYHELAEVRTWPSWAACRSAIGDEQRWFATTAGATQPRYDEIHYDPDDVFVFGRESDGLGPTVLADFPLERRLKIPMRPNNRSINLSNAVSIVVYEAWRQHGFAGGATGTFEEARPPRAYE